MHLDIFNDDAFKVSQLTLAINNLPKTPTRIGNLRLFNEQGISTTSVSIEMKDGTISLVPSAKRGSPGRPILDGKRKMVSIGAIHLPQAGNVLADEVQNLRAFGSETEVATVQGIVNDKLAIARNDLDVTLEYQRMGAIKGIVLDSDATTELYDMYDIFNVVQQVYDMNLDNSGTDVRARVVAAKRLVEDSLGGGITITGFLALCSPEFFDAISQHATVAEAFKLYNTAFASSDVRESFVFAGVRGEEYNGSVGAVRFIAAGDAYLVPLGIRNMFVTYFAPADYMETVNTLGLPYYAKQERMKFDKGVDIETQSNPIHLNTKPRSVVRLTLT